MSGAVLALAVALPLAAHAQALSIYGTFSDVRPSNVETGVTVARTGSTYNYSSFSVAGFGGGVTFGLLSAGPVRLGLDLRGSTRPGTTGADTAFAGLKLGLKLPVIHLKPYLQASGGYLATRTPNSSVYQTDPGPAFPATFTNQYAAYEILGGVDLPVVHFVDLRLVEVGGGQGYNTGITGLFSTAGTSNMSFYTINSGVVVHF